MLLKSSSKFVVGPPASGDVFVDRSKLLATLEGLITSTTGNLLIFGRRRAGKTSLCLRLLERPVPRKDALVTYMSMEANYERSPEQFTQAAIIHSIKKVAATLFSKRYSDLLKDMGKPRSLTGDYKRLLNLFELARGSQLTLGRSNAKEAGASLIATTTLKESDSTQVSISGLASFEHLELLGELVDFLKRKHIGKLVVLVDEANKLTLDSNARIIRENLSLFSARGLQFVFVTTPEVIEAVPEVDELFHQKVEVGPFEGPEAVRALIQQCVKLPDSVSELVTSRLFTDDAIDAIWKISRGVPYAVQLLCHQSFGEAVRRNADHVALEHVLDSIPEEGLGL